MLFYVRALSALWTNSD